MEKIIQKLLTCLVIVLTLTSYAKAQNHEPLEDLNEGTYRTGAYRACDVKIEKQKDQIIIMTPTSIGPYPVFPCQQGRQYIFECFQKPYAEYCQKTISRNISLKINARNRFTVFHYDNLGDFVGTYPYELIEEFDAN